MLCFLPTLVCASFNDDFAGARMLSMGGASSAISNEVDSLLNNPAGLYKIKSQQLFATLANIYAGLSDGSSITQNIVGYAYSQPEYGTAGLLWKRMAVSTLYSENIVGLGFSKSYVFGEKKRVLALGAVIKLLNWNVTPIIDSEGHILEELSGRTALSFDVGVILHPSTNTSIAFCAQNLGQPDLASKNSNTSEKMPLNIKLGVGAKLPKGTLTERTTWAMDLIFKSNQIDVKTGLERKFLDGQFLIRGGFRLENLAYGTNITIGSGFYPKPNFRVDYAFVFPIGNVLGTYGSHRVSVVYDF